MAADSTFWTNITSQQYWCHDFISDKLWFLTMSYNMIISPVL